MDSMSENSEYFSVISSIVKISRISLPNTRDRGSIMLEQNIEVLYAAFEPKDARFDGRFFVGIKSTGIYCRPEFAPGYAPVDASASLARRAAKYMEQNCGRDERMGSWQRGSGARTGICCKSKDNPVICRNCIGEEDRFRVLCRPPQSYGYTHVFAGNRTLDRELYCNEGARVYRWFPGHGPGDQKMLLPRDTKEILALAENWRPWRAYAAMCIWSQGA